MKTIEKIILSELAKLQPKQRLKILWRKKPFSIERHGNTLLLMKLLGEGENVLKQTLIKQCNQPIAGIQILQLFNQIYAVMVLKEPINLSNFDLMAATDY